MQWLIFGLMTGALLCAFLSVSNVLLGRARLRLGECSERSYLLDQTAALKCALLSASFLVILAVMGLWRVAGWVTR